MNTIYLQYANGYLFPSDISSRGALERELNVIKFSVDKIDIISPRLVRNGYKLAINGYMPKAYQPPYNREYIEAGNIRPQENPCSKCHMRGLCDEDDCGAKMFRLFTK